jgi:hypothetical protein
MAIISAAQQHDPVLWSKWLSQLSKKGFFKGDTQVPNGASGAGSLPPVAQAFEQPENLQRMAKAAESFLEKVGHKRYRRSASAPEQHKQAHQAREMQGQMQMGLQAAGMQPAQMGLGVQAAGMHQAQQMHMGSSGSSSGGTQLMHMGSQVTGMQQGVHQSPQTDSPQREKPWEGAERFLGPKRSGPGSGEHPLWGAKAVSAPTISSDTAAEMRSKLQSIESALIVGGGSGHAARSKARMAVGMGGGR